MPPQDTPSRKLDQYIVRFPDGMRDQLKAEAERSKRSLNAEIVARLEASLARKPLNEVVSDMRDELYRGVQSLAAALDAMDERDTRSGVLAAVQSAMGVNRSDLIDEFERRQASADPGAEGK